MHKRIFAEIDRRDGQPNSSGLQPPPWAPRAKQGYVPSNAQAAPMPDACALQTGEHCPISLKAGLLRSSYAHTPALAVGIYRPHPVQAPNFALHANWCTCPYILVTSHCRA